MKGIRDGLVALLALGLAACGDDNGVQSPDFTEQLAAIHIAPAAATVPVGRTVAFTATGSFTAPPGSASPTIDRPLDNVTWSVTGDAATIDGETGVAKGEAIGTAVVKASRDGLESNTATLTVAAPVLDRVVIVDADAETPAPLTADTMPEGSQRRYQLLGDYSDSETLRPIEGEAEWVSSDTAVATATTPGAITTVTAVEVGTSTITAAFGGQSAELALTVGDADVTGLLRLRPPFASVAPERSLQFQAIGSFTNGTEGIVPNTDLDWTSSANDIATVDANGLATGVAEGEAIITATLKESVSTVTGNRSASAELLVADTACTLPLLQGRGAQVTTQVDDLCILCGVDDPGNIIDENFASFGTVRVPVGLLNGRASVTVGLADDGEYELPFAPGSAPAFIIGRPAGALVLVELLSQIEVATLLDGAVQETSGPIIPLRLDLLGLELISGSETVLASVTNTSLPFDAVRLTLKSGVASVLTNVRVFSACADSQAPDTIPGLVRVAGVQPVSSDTVEVGAGAQYQLYGHFQDDSEQVLPNSVVDWSSNSPGTATVDANGLASGVAPGTATLTARLKDGVNPEVTDRQATGEVTVIPAICTSPLLASEGAVVDHDSGGLCLVCRVTDDANVIDDATTNFATMSINLGVLSEVSMTVSSAASAPETAPFPSGQVAGFVIGTPSAPVVEAQILSQIEVSTLRNGEVVTSSGSLIPLRLDLLGLNLTANSDTALVSLASTGDFDAIRLRFSGGLASVLSNVQVFRACSNVDLP